jgi:hypothetical protein
MFYDYWHGENQVRGFVGLLELWELFFRLLHMILKIFDCIAFRYYKARYFDTVRCITTTIEMFYFIVDGQLCVFVKYHV